ncbi:hypothetical protein JMJ58_18565 [Haloterrigena salifodinae]|uniref:Uncharacterized protein n=1 Tax=Haloterrigena salifodinae TaxID=2675099 RepID=A0A8T8DZ69_9EURY|nr:hypothetical protein [Haloterrigena salifodinae]QRV14894.1 hypothetical protein JMJ58_18565 [Haloterrigena salifodinae]
MSRETAITEEISYTTDNCDVCGDEVAVDDVPGDVIEPQGYAVLLGEGAVTHQSEDAGNWDEEVHFELEKDVSDLPTVSAYITCENCVEGIHGISPETRPYTGTLPPELTAASRQNITSEEVSDGVKALVYLVGAVLVLIFLFALL